MQLFPVASRLHPGQRTGLDSVAVAGTPVFRPQYCRNGGHRTVEERQEVASGAFSLARKQVKTFSAAVNPVVMLRSAVKPGV